MKICDAHCHFFSSRFFDLLARQSPALREAEDPGAEAVRQLGWDAPGEPAELAARWVEELDRHGVSRCALIGSVPGDELSVEKAVQAFPDRFVGYSMLDPYQLNENRLDSLLSRGAVQVIALFPAMHRFRLEEDRAMRVLEIVQRHTGTAVFIHCGILTVGIRAKLGLPSDFDMRLGNPLDLQAAASTFPDLPLLIPHFGAGYLRESLMLASLHPNVYLDTSSSNSWIRCQPGLTLRQVFEAALAVVGPRRLLFGTDSSFFPRGWQNSIWQQQEPFLLDIVGTTDAAWILHGNFDRLFPNPAHQGRS